MGKKNHHKQPKSDVKKTQYKLSTKKRGEISHLADKLLRISTVPNALTATQAIDLQKEISQILEHLKQLEFGLADSVDKKTDAIDIQTFTKWAQDNGAKFDNVDVAEFKGFGRGLKVTKDVAKESLVVTVPRTLMLTSETAQKSILGPLIERDTMLQNMHNVALSLHLLVEKFKGDSFWKPYIDILPSSYSTVLYFTMDELMELRNSQTFDLALKQIKNIARQYAYFYKLIWTSDDPACKILQEKFTYEQYRWAVSSVMTRQNSVPSEDGTQMISAFIPVWDFCNHTNGNITTDYNPVLHQSECWALQHFKVNEQLFIFYGPRSNTELFIHNGFVHKENMHDVYLLKLGISKFDMFHDRRLELLKRLDIPANAEFELKLGPMPIEEKLLAFVRIYKMNEEQLQHWLQSEKYNDLQHIDCALETDLEDSVWSFLHARLKLLIAMYGDKKKKNEDLTPNLELILEMKDSELRVLQGVLDYIEQRYKKIK